MKVDNGRLTRLKNRAIAKVITRFPSLSGVLINSFRPWETSGVPWAPPLKPLRECRVALVTTAGVHHAGQRPFDMKDPNGDPSFRVIDTAGGPGPLMITHDYYDHTDAERDINIVFPLDRLRELEAAGVIGEVSPVHMGFMGHITGGHIDTLVNETAPEAAALLVREGVDAVLLTPG